jgi:hypothetical protein
MAFLQVVEHDEGVVHVLPECFGATFAMDGSGAKKVCPVSRSPAYSMTYLAPEITSVLTIWLVTLLTNSPGWVRMSSCQPVEASDDDGKPVA